MSHNISTFNTTTGFVDNERLVSKKNENSTSDGYIFNKLNRHSFEIKVSLFRVSDLPWLGGNQRENSFYTYQNVEMFITIVAKGADATIWH